MSAPGASSAMTQLQHQEIERKFLVQELPGDLDIGPGTALRQGYLAIDLERKLSVRIRQGERAVLTIKQGRGIARTEVELPLSSDQFEVLWPSTVARIDKRRHEIDIDSHSIELDIFNEELAGLVLAEVEFTTLEDAKAFVPPAWFGTDVTEDSRYLNQTLAVQGLPDAENSHD
jgi:adenylate cyclase